MAKTKKTKRNTGKKPNVSLIGLGRLGTALAIALDSASYEIVSLVGRSRRNLRTTANNLDVEPILRVGKELEKGPLGDLVIVAVPDDQVVEVAGNLARVRTTSTVLHTSGALSSTVLDGLRKTGWHTGSMHPLASISDPVMGVEALRKAYWCVEGDATAMRSARRIVADLGAHSFSIDSKDKPLYHAAAVMSSGNLTALFDVALGMLERCGVSRRNAQKILTPLLASNTLNLMHSDPQRALTGTFARGDLETVKLHLAALADKELDEALKLYQLLGQHSLKLAKDKIPSEIEGEIEKLLR